MHYKELMSDGFIKRVLGCSAFNTPLFGLKETMQFKGDLGKSLALELADPQDPSLLNPKPPAQCPTSASGSSTWA